MPLDDTMLYEQFAAARLKAVELTDAYRETAADDPRRAVLWEGVVRQTELARGLLESWLASGPSSVGARGTANALGAGR
jgi:hypothetical protein